MDALREAAAGLTPLSSGSGAQDLLAPRHFHAVIHRASGNDQLVLLLDGVWDKADRYRRAGLQVDRSEDEKRRTAREHTALLDCVVSKDEHGAASVMQQHISTSIGATSGS